MWPGMTLLLSTVFWESQYRGRDDAAVASELKRLAQQVDLTQYKKVTRTFRHPPPKRKSSKYTPHISTAPPWQNGNDSFKALVANLRSDSWFLCLEKLRLIGHGQNDDGAVVIPPQKVGLPGRLFDENAQ